MKTNFYIVSNDNFFLQNKNIYGANKNTHTILNFFSKKKYNSKLIARLDNNINLKKQKIKNMEFINFKKILSIKNNLNNSKFLFLSITPFNFVILIILLFSHIRKKDFFLFLRSDGFKEYKIKFGFIGYYFYYIMFYFFKKNTNIFSVSSTFTNIHKTKVIYPSEITNTWNTRTQYKKIKKQINFLYVGRFKVEKGYNFLINLFDKLSVNYKLNMVGSTKNKKYLKKNIKTYKYIYDIKYLKKFYDNSNIFILPSYTEGYPQVILESLSRLRPVIVFSEIAFLKKQFKHGIFVSKRNVLDFENTVKHIVTNYDKIIKNMKKNKILLKKDYQKSILEYLNYE